MVGQKTVRLLFFFSFEKIDGTERICVKYQPIWPHGSFVFPLFVPQWGNWTLRQYGRYRASRAWAELPQQAATLAVSSWKEPFLAVIRVRTKDRHLPTNCKHCFSVSLKLLNHIYCLGPFVPIGLFVILCNAKINFRSTVTWLDQSCIWSNACGYDRPAGVWGDDDASEKGKHCPDNGEQLVGSVTPACLARVQTSVRL